MLIFHSYYDILITILLGLQHSNTANGQAFICDSDSKCAGQLLRCQNRQDVMQPVLQVLELEMANQNDHEGATEFI